jgi:hypothetical protein
MNHPKARLRSDSVGRYKSFCKNDLKVLDQQRAVGPGWRLVPVVRSPRKRDETLEIVTILTDTVLTSRVTKTQKKSPQFRRHIWKDAEPIPCRFGHLPSSDHTIYCGVVWCQYQILW